MITMTTKTNLLSLVDTIGCADFAAASKGAATVWPLWEAPARLDPQNAKKRGRQEEADEDKEEKEDKDEDDEKSLAGDEDAETDDAEEAGDKGKKADEDEEWEEEDDDLEDDA